jgi:hypothetical protein
MMPHKESLDHIKILVVMLKKWITTVEQEVAYELCDSTDSDELIMEIENAKDLLQSFTESIEQIIYLGGEQ